MTSAIDRKNAKDAKRYLWLKNYMLQRYDLEDWRRLRFGWGDYIGIEPDPFDAAVDARMKEGPFK